MVFDHLSLAPAVRERLDPGMTWGGWHVPTGVEVAMLAVIGLVLLVVANVQFNKTD
jgi:ABC-2 type transport system permease protein